MRIHLWFVVALICVLVGGPPVWAQQSSGSISGVVQDSQGAVVPGAKVTLINQAQGGVARELPASAEGTFFFTPIIPGTYTVTVEV